MATSSSSSSSSSSSLSLSDGGDAVAVAAAAAAVAGDETEIAAAAARAAAAAGGGGDPDAFSPRSTSVPPFTRLESLARMRKLSMQLTAGVSPQLAKSSSAPPVLISNAKTMFAEIDRVLGRGPPAVEYLFVEDVAQMNNPFQRFSPLGFGHACVRYRVGEEQFLVNINREMVVNFEDPESYVFGVINVRNIASVRVEKWKDSSVLAMHYYFKSVVHAREGNERLAQFDITGGGFSRLVKFFFPMRGGRRGNCSVWTSRGLLNAGLLTKSFSFPKHMFIDMVEELEADNINIVYYKQTPRGAATRKRRFVNSIVSPLQIMRTIRYWNLERMADVVVVTDDDGKTMTSRAIVGKKQRNPPSFFARYAHFFFGLVLGIWWVFYGWPRTDALVPLGTVLRMLVVMMVWVFDSLMS